MKKTTAPAPALRNFDADVALDPAARAELTALEYFLVALECFAANGGSSKLSGETARPLLRRGWITKTGNSASGRHGWPARYQLTPEGSRKARTGLTAAPVAIERLCALADAMLERIGDAMRAADASPRSPAPATARAKRARAASTSSIRRAKRESDTDALNVEGPGA